MMNRNQPIPLLLNFNSISPSPQNFSLPSPIIHYIRKFSNPSLALYKTCKYFYVKYPIIVEDHLQFSCWSPKWEVVDPDNINESLYEFDPSTFKYKIWITEKFEIYSLGREIDANVASDMCKIIFRCDISRLQIEDQIISYKEFLLLTASNKLIYVRIEKTIVKNSDGSLVHPEIIFSRCSRVKKFLYKYADDAAINPTTAKAITKLPQFLNLKHFIFRNIPEGFDFKIFTKFIKNNPRVRCQLSFNKNLSESYITKLNNYVDKIIQRNATPPPYLGFPGQKERTSGTLWMMQTRFFPSFSS